MPNLQSDGRYTLKSIYQQTSADILALKSTLPEAAVRSLAKEALSHLANRASKPASRTGPIVELCNALIGSDASEAAERIEVLMAAGVEDDAIYLAYLAPAARQLGDWWEEDKVTFGEVTMGTGRIYGIMRTLGRQMRAPMIPERKSALVASVPGETHTLGPKMATDLLRAQGWIVELAMDPTHEELMARIVEGRHLIVGVSAGGEHALAPLARLVVGIRLTQPYANILISGNIVQEAGDRVKLMGVDGMSNNFAEASRMLDEMWESVAGRDA